MTRADRHNTNVQTNARAAGGGEDAAVTGGIDLSDVQVFARIWKAEKQSLYWIALRILEDRQEAQDVVTEAFVQLHQRSLRRAVGGEAGGSPVVFAHEGAVRAWLRVTVRNKSLTLAEQHRHQQARLNELSALFHDIETQWYQEDVLARLLTQLYQDIEALPSKRKAIFKLRYFSRLSNEEIAAQLGIEHQSVRNHLVKALKALRLSMAQYSHLLGVLLLMLRTKD